MKWLLFLLITVCLGFVSAGLEVAEEYDDSLPVVILAPETSISGDTNETIRFNNLVGNCTAGNFVFGIDEDGFKICDAPAGGGDITAVFAGTGLTGGGSSGDVTLNVNETWLNNSIDLRDNDTTYTAGSNLTLIGTEFAVNTTGIRSWLDNIYVQLTNLVSLVGNWSADKDNYYNKTEIDNSQFINQTYGNTTYIKQEDENNLNVNSSNYWDGLDTPADILGSQINNDLSWINTSGSGYAPTNINLTTETYNGDIEMAGLVGYEAADNICDSNFTGSHFCTEFEVALYQGDDVTGDAWIIAGSPKYIPATVPVNDCQGWTYSGTTTALGNYWHFDTDGKGEGRAINCGTTLKLACCSY